MSIRSGFYDALLVDGEPDREYSTLDMGSIFDGIINDGVYMAIGEQFRVKASSGMRVLVGSGRAWVSHSWLYNDAAYPIDIETAESAQNRIDTIYLEINREVGVRSGGIKYKRGAPALHPVAPSLTNNLEIHQYPIADVYVKAETRTIYQANITNRVGTDDFPFVNGILKTISTSDLVAQWESQFEILLAKMEAELKTRTDILQEQIDSVTQGSIAKGSVSSWIHFTIPSPDDIVLPQQGQWIDDSNGAHINIVVNGFKNGDNPIVDIDYSNISNWDKMLSVSDAWGSVYKINATNDQVTVYTTNIPDVSIPVKAQCVRK